MSETNTKNSGGHNNNYPFLTKAQIKQELLASDKAVCNAILKLDGRQTSHEQSINATRETNKRGWMSSDASRMGKLADKLAAGESLTPEEMALGRDRTSHYTKQLAAYARNEAMDANPELVASTAAFFTPQPTK